MQQLLDELKIRIRGENNTEYYKKMAENHEINMLGGNIKTPDP